jgi:hypothetical protein
VQRLRRGESSNHLPPSRLLFYQTDCHLSLRYSLQDGASFIEQARTATFDLNGDDGIVAREQKASQLKWDRKKRKFVQGDGTGSDNKKLIRSESGARLPASFKSGRFEEWKEKKKINLPKVGESEGDIPRQVGYGDDKRYRHNKVTEAKPLDPKSTTYEKKMYVAKKKAEKEQEGAPESAGKGGKGKRGAVGQAKNELRSSEDIRRQRKMLEQVSENGTRRDSAKFATDDHILCSAKRRMLDLRRKGARGRGKGKGADDTALYGAWAMAPVVCRVGGHEHVGYLYLYLFAQFRCDSHGGELGTNQDDHRQW